MRYTLMIGGLKSLEQTPFAEEGDLLGKWFTHYCLDLTVIRC